MYSGAEQQLPDQAKCNSDRQRSNVLVQKQNGRVKRITTEIDENIFIEIEPERIKWNNKIDFLVACIGFSVGLGNIWRFPYLCFKHGGGAFLVPYFISLIIGGFPSFLLEVSLGQLMSRGGIEAWEIIPLLKGIGLAGVLVGLFLNTYYNVIIAWGLHFLFSSFQATLPWSECGSDWSTSQCLSSTHKNTTGPAIDSTVEYWELRVLNISEGIETPGKILYELALCLLLGWIIVYLCIIKGIRTSGKVLYFTAPFPYILLLVMLMRTCLLPGSLEGILFYLTPDFNKLTDLTMWVDAGTQIFFTYSIGLGTLTSLGSFNSFNHNSFRDCIVFAIVNSGTSIFAGFVIFATLGFMAHNQGVSVNEVAAQGPGLVFIVYPEALGSMPLAPLWSVLFFIMLLMLGLNTQFVAVEGMITGVADMLPKLLTGGHKRSIFTLIGCIFMFFFGLSMVTQGGMYVFQLFDYFIGSRITLVVAAIQCLGIVYGYGGFRYLKNLEKMYGFSPGKILVAFWSSITPLFCILLFICSVCVYQELDYLPKTRGIVYKYPTWSIILGWLMASFCIITVPTMAAYKVYNSPGSNWKERFRNAMKPNFRSTTALLLNEPVNQMNGTAQPITYEEIPSPNITKTRV